MSSISLQPNALLGRYPERAEKRRGLPDRIVATVRGWIGYPQWMHGARARRFVAMVHAEALELRCLDDTTLQASVRALRLRLLGEGLVDTAVAKSFALVREIASRGIGQRHFDVQLTGGWVMMQGMLAEMQTGEGKTLTATLPACTAALAGIPVHVITVNDYLASRDATTMGPVYRALGLSVGVISASMQPDERRQAYACDITYCTAKQIAFDYLRDRITLGGNRDDLRLNLEDLHAQAPRSARMNLRGLCFCIVDEADSVLIDEARTPLLIAGPSKAHDSQSVFREALGIARQLQAGSDFVIDPVARSIELTAPGAQRLATLAAPLGGLWTGRRRRLELMEQALSALHLFILDKHYLVREKKVQIVDQHTGRIMQDRTWQRGLHQMIEAKEDCDLTAPPETLARISFQQFFRRYLRLAGMTGTASDVASELWSVYNLRVVAVPTHRPVQRLLSGQQVHATATRKWAAVVDSVRRHHAASRPVLIGTTSVADSEHLSGLLEAHKLPHKVLSARHNRSEAYIVARAGRPGQITVATNMAGRGTDIPLGSGVVQSGGLHVIATERNEARRIDRQLIGRCARQGDPGSFELILSLDDALVVTYCPPMLRRFASHVAERAETLPAWLGLTVQRLSQRNAEHCHRRARAQLKDLNEFIENGLAFSGQFE